MTFDEWKEYLKAALDAAGDITPESRAGLVMTAMQTAHIQMPSDIKRIEESMQAGPGDLSITGNNWRGPGGAARQVPRIG